MLLLLLPVLPVVVRVSCASACLSHLKPVFVALCETRWSPRLARRIPVRWWCAHLRLTRGVDANTTTWSAQAATQIDYFVTVPSASALRHAREPHGAVAVCWVVAE